MGRANKYKIVDTLADDDFEDRVVGDPVGQIGELPVIPDTPFLGDDSIEASNITAKWDGEGDAGLPTSLMLVKIPDEGLQYDGLRVSFDLFVPTKTEDLQMELTMKFGAAQIAMVFPPAADPNGAIATVSATGGVPGVVNQFSDSKKLVTGQYMHIEIAWANTDGVAHMDASIVADGKLNKANFRQGDLALPPGVVRNPTEILFSLAAQSEDDDIVHFDNFQIHTCKLKNPESLTP